MGSAIFRKRGDTYAIELTVTNRAGVPQNINGKRYVLTANSQANPEDASSELFQLVGEITDYENGEVEFPMTDEQANHVGQFHYDVEETDDGPFIWTPPTAPADGDTISFDGSDGFYVLNIYEVPVLPTYQTRDTRRVIRTAFDNTAGGQYATMGFLPLGSEFIRQSYPGYGWEWKLTVYLNLGLVSFELQDGLYGNIHYPSVDNRDGTAAGDLAGAVQTADGLSLVYNAATPTDLTGFAEGWYVIGIRLDTDGLCYGCTVREQDDEEWILMNANPWPPALLPITLTPHLWNRPVHPYNAAALIDVWKYEWSRL